MVLVMGLVGLIASVLLVGTYRITEPRIAANRAEYLERAIFEVLPGAEQKTIFLVSNGRLVPSTDERASGERVFAGYDRSGHLIGVAVEAQGQGFQDVLKILYGYVPACECIVGMKVLETKETPGLGDKIEKDEGFLANFEALDATVDPTKDALARRIGLVKQGQKSNPWEIEAITGATVSSRAVADIIDASASRIVPLVTRNLPQLEHSPDSTHPEREPAAGAGREAEVHAKAGTRPMP